MAKQGRGTKKARGANPGKNKARRPGGKLEAQVRGYWKRENWGAFVTLYIRQKDKLAKTSVRELWDKGVYNALAQAVFVDRDPGVLVGLLENLEHGPEISAANEVIMHVCRVCARMWQGQTVGTAWHDLPEDLPGPFGALRESMITAKSDAAALVDYYREDPKRRCRKGDKPYASLARFATFYEQSFLPVDCRPESRTPLAQWEKLLKAPWEVTGTGLEEDPVIWDVTRIIEMIRETYVKHTPLSDPRKVGQELELCRFHGVPVPLVRQMTAIFLRSGSRRFGNAWAVEVGRSLVARWPECLVGSGASGREISRALEVLHSSAYRDGELNMRTLVEEFQKRMDLSWREEVLFILVGIEDITDVLKMASIKDLQWGRPSLSSVKEAFIDLFEQVARLRKIAERIGTQEDIAERWATKEVDTVLAIPLPDENKYFSELPAYLQKCGVAPSTRILAATKMVSLFANAKIDPFVKGVIAAAPVKLGQKTSKRLAFFVSGMIFDVDVLNFLQQVMVPDDYRHMVREIVHEFLEPYLDPEGEPVPETTGFAAEMAPWMWERLAVDAGSDFHLAGFLAMQATTRSTTFPMSYKQAEPFFTALPDDPVCFSLVLWMLTWDKTRYASEFLLAIIEALQGYIGTTGQWAFFAKHLKELCFNKACSMLWEFWIREGFQENVANRDLREAMRLLKRFHPDWKVTNRTSKKTSGKKGKKIREVPRSLLDVLE